MSTQPTLEILIGDVRAKLRELKAAGRKVKMVMTSPPYFGLRCYGTEPQIWGGAPECLHQWDAEKKIHRGGPQGPGGVLGEKDMSARDAVGDILPGSTCRNCGAWMGEIGLEPRMSMWVEHIVEVFDMVWDVLEDDGTLWVNFGDSYAQGGRGADTGSNLGGSRRNQRESRLANNRTHDKSLGEKQLMGQPWRAAFALQDAGWILRQDIIWAKPAPMPESIRDRFTKSHEYLFLFAKQRKYYFDQDAVKEPVSGGAHARGPGNKKNSYTTLYEETGDPKHHTKAGLVAFADRERAKRAGVNPKADIPDGWVADPGPHTAVAHSQGEKTLGRKQQDLKDADGFGHGPGWRVKANESFSAAVTDLVPSRNKRSVWWIPAEPYAGAHYATFPTGLVRPCVLAGSAPGDTVMDIFGGSGTVGAVAAEYGRSCILIDLDPRNEKLMLDRQPDTPGFAL
jgi:DNA modification methylase